MSSFLTAQWQNLVMANYAVDRSILLPYLPAHTELDDFGGVDYVSLVGFLFADTKVKGIPIPFHRTFEEINLRFYVRHQHTDGTWRRGVVFIKEIVPRFMIALVANQLYGEHYIAVPTRHHWAEAPERLELSYEWKMHNTWQRLSASVNPAPQPLAEDSLEQFIAEHYWGYTRLSPEKTSEYEVVHPSWAHYPVLDSKVEVDFGMVYGEAFAGLSSRLPESVLVAQGSAISVQGGRKI